jgi:regulatory protein
LQGKKHPAKGPTEEPEPVEKLYDASVKALARRAHSTAEIRLLLEKKKAGKRQIEAVVKRLRENGYLDDARFARYFAASRLEGELQGKERVRRDLRSRGLQEEIAQEAVSQAYQGSDEADLLRRYLKRRVNLPRAFSKPSAVVSLFRRLLRAGFASDTIVRELKKIRESPLVKDRATPSGSEPVAWDELLDSLSDPAGRDETEVDVD